MSLLRQPLLLLSRSAAVRSAFTALASSSGVVSKYVAGDSTAAAVTAAEGLIGEGLSVTLDFLGEDTHEVQQAEATVAAYVDLLAEMSRSGLADRSEVSVKLTAIGLALADGGPDLALANAHRICRAADAAGAMVTVDMEDSTATDATLKIVTALREDFPRTGTVLQAHLRRTEGDCRALAYAGSRVRLCKGAYAEPEQVAFTDRHEIDQSFVRCAKVLMRGSGYPMIATHDPRMIAIAGALAADAGRSPGDHEFQMLYGIRTDEQRRLSAEGETMRVYVPYGVEWYGYLMRRIAERPQNLSMLLKSLISKK